VIGGFLGALVYEYVFYEGGIRGEDLMKAYRLDKVLDRIIPGSRA